MPLELLEYAVFSNQEAVAANVGSAEIDLPDQVPAGETWRVDRIAAQIIVPAADEIFLETVLQPTLFAYDQISPGPTVIPTDVTNLSVYSRALTGVLTASLYFIDSDDLSAPITIVSGRQLALVFVIPWANTPWTAFARVQYSRYQGTAGQPQPAAGLGPSPSIPPSI